MGTLKHEACHDNFGGHPKPNDDVPVFDAPKLLTRDEARRIAVNVAIAKLPERNLAGIVCCVEAVCGTY